eukprot:scaffold32037_cov66-Phaeocystis_antarctica.AAC.3
MVAWDRLRAPPGCRRDLTEHAANTGLVNLQMGVPMFEWWALTVAVNVGARRPARAKRGHDLARVHAHVHKRDRVKRAGDNLRLCLCPGVRHAGVIDERHGGRGWGRAVVRWRPGCPCEPSGVELALVRLRCHVAHRNGLVEAAHRVVPSLKGVPHAGSAIEGAQPRRVARSQTLQDRHHLEVRFHLGL